MREITSEIKNRKNQIVEYIDNEDKKIRISVGPEIRKTAYSGRRKINSLRIFQNNKLVERIHLYGSGILPNDIAMIEIKAQEWASLQYSIEEVQKSLYDFLAEIQEGEKKNEDEEDLNINQGRIDSYIAEGSKNPKSKKHITFLKKQRWE